MLEQGTTVYPQTVIDAGVDWLTATRKHGEGVRPFLEAGNAILQQERDAGGDVKPASLRDYVGHKGKHFFVGSRPADSIIVLSGPQCPPHWRTVAQAATNVSRLDIQVTTWTHGEQPQVAREQYARLRALPPSRGRPRNYSLVQSHPQGETLYVGKRTSDYYGRVYDWAAAHKAGVPLTVWRYEVEIKRLPARAYSHALACEPLDTISAINHVHSWFSDRKLEMMWSTDSREVKLLGHVGPIHRRPLAWLEDSVSKTVARLINDHGLPRVIFALGLGDLVRPLTEEEKRDATVTTRPVSSISVRRDSRTDHAECFPLPNAVE